MISQLLYYKFRTITIIKCNDIPLCTIATGGGGGGEVTHTI